MTRDQQLIIALVCGHTVRDKRGRPRKVYPEKDSALELEARYALARELRSPSPLDPGLRSVLADLIDPDFDRANRQIKFARRRKGNPAGNALAEKEVAEFIWAKVRAGVGVESAVAAAKDEFGLARSRLFEIWSHWQPILKRLKREDQ